MGKTSRDYAEKLAEELYPISEKEDNELFIKIQKWCIDSYIEGKLPDLQGDWFELAKYMKPNLEVIGTIYDTPELMSDGKKN